MLVAEFGFLLDAEFAAENEGRIVVPVALGPQSIALRHRALFAESEELLDVFRAEFREKTEFFLCGDYRHNPS